MRILVLFLICSVLCSGKTLYISQSGAGTGDALTEANAGSVTFFNTSGNWGVGAGKITAGDTVTLVGTITTALAVQASGSSGNVTTILFGTGAKLSKATWSGGAITLFQKDYITIDGGASGTIGGSNGNTAGINGKIECTDNGTSLGNQVTSTGISSNGCQHLTVKNLAIENIFVRVAGSTTTAGGSAIVMSDGNGRGMNDLLVTNCYIHDAQTGVNWDYGAAGGTNYELSYSTIFNVNWGGRCGDREAGSAMTGLSVHDNVLRDFRNWDQPTDLGFHHNGFYAWAESGGTLNACSFYNNVIGPNFTDSLSGYNAATGGLFFSGNVAGPILVYNNLFDNSTNKGPSNGLITFGTQIAGTLRVMNNTFISGDSTQAVNFSKIGASADILTVYTQNNLFSGACYAITSLYSTNVSLTSNHNLGFNLLSSPFKWGTGGSGSGVSLASWKSSTSQDADWVTSDPLLDSGYAITVGSPAIGAGTDLSAYFTTDKAGITRTTWDIGAYAYVASSSSGTKCGGKATHGGKRL